MLERVSAFIKQYGLIEPGQCVTVGVSGGIDSVTLLHALLSLSKGMGFRVCAAHLNHGIRGESAERDERFVTELAEFYGTPFYCERMDIPAIAKARHKTLEQAGREERYGFLERARKHMGADLVAVAHHMDDQAESILLHLIRGSGLVGLTGMQPRRGGIIRPLLSIRRSEIEAYAASEGLAYCVDETNLVGEGARNRLRLELIPYIEEHFNPAIVTTLSSMGELLLRDENHLASEAAAALADARRGDGYARGALLALPVPIRARAMRMALADAGAASDIMRVHVESAMELLAARTGAKLTLPNVDAWTSYDLIHFGRRASAAPFETDFCPDGETVTPSRIFTARSAELCEFVRDPSVAFMDADKLARLAGPVVARTRRDGDRFYAVNAPGRRKLKEFFIDKKMPREARERPILCAGGEVLYVPGHCISELVKVDETTRRMLRIEYLEKP